MYLKCSHGESHCVCTSSVHIWYGYLSVCVHRLFAHHFVFCMPLFLELQFCEQCTYMVLLCCCATPTTVSHLQGRQELTPVAVKAGKMLARRLFGGTSEVMNYHMVSLAGCASHMQD